NIKRKAPARNDKDNWKVVDYFSDIICVKDDVAENKHKHIQNRNIRIGCRRRKQEHVMPQQNETIKRRRKNKANISLSDGEIISDEEMILSDFSLSPETKTEPRHRKDNDTEVVGKGAKSAKDRLGPSVHNRNYKSSRYDKVRSRSKRDDHDSSDHSPVHDARDKKRIVQVSSESLHSRYSDHHYRSHRPHDQSDDRSLRKQSSPDLYRDRGRKRVEASPEPYRDGKRGETMASPVSHQRRKRSESSPEVHRDRKSPDSYHEHRRKKLESSPEPYRDRKKGDSSPEPHQGRKRSLEKHKSKRHSKLCTKRGGGKSKSSSDCFDEDKYYGSDRSRIRNLKKKYNEYLKYARKYKHEDEDSGHIEQFARMRSKLRGEESDEKRATETLEPSIDYKKEEEKFLRSLETYLEIKKKQEKSMPSTIVEPVTNVSSGSKEYDPDNISSEEEEYVPEEFTPEDITSGQVEEYDPCSVPNTSETNVTYQPTKIDEYEPITLRLDEEYCPMPIQSALPLTYNPTKKFGQNNPFQQQSVARRPVWRKPNFKQYLSGSKPHSSMKVNKTVSAQKVVSKNTVFIGNTINPIALNANVNLLSTPSIPTTAPNIEKTKIMSKLVNEKLLEIEKKKLQLLEEINRKKLLKIKEKCDEVELRKLEKKKSDLMLELNSYKDSKTIEISSGKHGNNQVGLHESNTIKIKQEKSDLTLGTTSIINTKLDALEKKKAELKLEIQKKLSKNTEVVNKERADIRSRLKELEKNRASLLAQMEKKEAEKTKNDVNSVVIKEEKNASKEFNTESSQTAPVVTKVHDTPAKISTIKIKEEKILCEKPLLQTSIKGPTVIVKNVDGKAKPLINEKLSELEKEKAKLMAAIAAKSRESTAATGTVKQEIVELNTPSAKALNEKLEKLSKDKEQLLAEIEKKRNLAGPAVLNGLINRNISDLNSKENDLKANKEKVDNTHTKIPKVTIKQEKIDNHLKVDSFNYGQNKGKISVRQDLKEDEKKLLSAEDLDAKIKNLEKQRSELLHTLAKRLPLGSTSKEIMKDVKSSSAATDRMANVSVKKHPLQKSPKAIASLANEVKTKVNQQLSEINKKKMELMEKIQSKSLNSTSKVIGTDSTPNFIDKTENVSKQLMELTAAKIKLLMEIEKKTSSDKENIVEKKEVHLTDLVKQSKREWKEDDANIQSGHPDNNTLSIKCDDAVFKVPSVPRLKKPSTKPQRSTIRKKKMMRPTKMRLDKNQKRKMKVYLREKKIEMLKKYVKVNVFNALWTKPETDVSGNLNETTEKSTDLPEMSTETTEISVNTESSISNDSMSQDVSQDQNENTTLIMQYIGGDKESTDDGNDDGTISTATELNKANKELVKNNELTVGSTDDNIVHGTNSVVDDDDEIVELPPPTPKPRELITIEDEDQDTRGLEDDTLGDVRHKEILGHIDTVDHKMKSDDYDGGGGGGNSDEFITLKCIRIKVEKLDDIDKRDKGGDDKTDDPEDNNDDHPSKTEDQNEITSYLDTNKSANDQTSSAGDNAQTQTESHTKTSDYNRKIVDSETKSPNKYDGVFISDDDIVLIDDTVDDDYENLVQEYDALAAIEAELAKLNPNANDYVLDTIEDDDDVILDYGSGETVVPNVPKNDVDFNPINSIDDTKGTPKLRRYEKNLKSAMLGISNSPVVSRLILNNKRKLISGQLNHLEKNKNLAAKLANHNFLSKFKFVHSNVATRVKCGAPKMAGLAVETKLLKNKLGKLYSESVEKHPSKLEYSTDKTLKTDAKENQFKTELKDSTLNAKKYRKHLSVYKFEKKTNRYKLDNAKKIGTNKMCVSPNLKLTNYQSTAPNDSSYSNGKSSVISKFKLDHKSNPKRSNYKTLPPSIRRQVETFVNLSQGLNAKSNKVSPSQDLPCSQQCFQTRTALKKCTTARPKFKQSRTSINLCCVFDEKASSKINRTSSRIENGNENISGKMLKSKYKFWRASSEMNTSANGKYRTKNRVLKRTTSPRKFQDETFSFSSKFHKVAEDTQLSLRSSVNKTGSKYLKLNRLVSKYKMVRISNQRERNRMNLSQRVRETSFPNRTMKVIKLNGTSYKVSSRSLRRKTSSSCLEPKSTTPSLLPKRAPNSCAPIEREHLLQQTNHRQTPSHIIKATELRSAHISTEKK
ncbi:hypothetical protein WDU94_001230, partial [Cyamophila willieti]